MPRRKRLSVMNLFQIAGRLSDGDRRKRFYIIWRRVPAPFYRPRPLKDAPVILLDEATASLDVDNETEIQNAISKLVKGKTVLIIAHRMRTVEAADNIIVLSDGIVAENGTHEELMKENGLYHRLVDLQTASANWKLSV